MLYLHNLLLVLWWTRYLIGFVAVLALVTLWCCQHLDAHEWDVVTERREVE